MNTLLLLKLVSGFEYFPLYPLLNPQPLNRYVPSSDTAFVHVGGKGGLGLARLPRSQHRQEPEKIGKMTDPTTT